ncbi:hypothetical protein P280DRAFT_517905 [Massarina eburnea CBS 473.64]|uniref:ACB domain-containing protein n=1 Tax=Massarina eburnea CBS 473.64 TaxID=1395130 RepID=A0A6A6RZ92_9PLEO|nr:hypothetical protein P280DRAFT_517905 [Massarina eburnea CBS 473.64]
MSDSVDRVFSHALNTVNKIRTGSQKPPSATRLKLYGLYKQAMEGDVDGIMERPEGGRDETHRAREKWDAWKQQNGLSRTEAKRRYITTLIDTMHKYASPSPDTRELVSELEFVWDQVKSNVPSSLSSSPLHKRDSTGSQMAASGYPKLDSGKGKGRADDDNEGPLQAKSPMSQSEEELEDEEADIDREEFVDAPDSQYNPNSEPPAEETDVKTDVKTGLQTQEPVPYATPQKPPGRSIGLLPALFTTPTAAPNGPSYETAADKKWRKRVEQALVKMTAEVAALREQLESRRLFTHSKKFIFFRFLFRLVWRSLKHVAIDVFILSIVLVWMRRKKDKRLEGAIRVLLGDAVAQVQKVGGKQFGKVKLPALVGGAKKVD